MYHNKDLEYWNGYYGKGLAPEPPSGFAKFALGYMHKGRELIDLGCGNGRDSVYFCRHGIKVTAVDSSKEAIEFFESSMPITAVCDDFLKTIAWYHAEFDYCYARWSIHAINQSQQDELLPGVFQALKKGGLFFSESRTISDVKYGQGRPLGEHEYFIDKHYRRFLDPQTFLEQLAEVGFEIVYSEESDSFSVMESDAPALIRVIAKKRQGY